MLQCQMFKLNMAKVSNNEVEIIPGSKKHQLQTALNARFPTFFLLSAQAGVDSLQISLYDHLLHTQCEFTAPLS